MESEGNSELDLQLIELQEFLGREQISYKLNVLGSNLATVRIGGPLRILVEPTTGQQLSSLLGWLVAAQVVPEFLGAGSNLLISDTGVPGVTVRLGRGFRFWERRSGSRIYAGGAMPLMTLARECAASGLSGLEFTAGIPGSLGGGVRMNAGAHGGELAGCLVDLQLMTRQGQELTVQAAELNFAYRHSELPAGSIVVGATFDLIEGVKGEIEEKLRLMLAYRKATQPLTLPSLGSVFANPEGIAAGKLLEDLALKGVACGGIMVSELHANWLVNPKGAGTAEQFLNLVQQCEQRALSERQIALRREFKQLGF